MGDYGLHGVVVESHVSCGEVIRELCHRMGGYFYCNEHHGDEYYGNEYFRTRPHGLGEFGKFRLLSPKRYHGQRSYPKPVAPAPVAVEPNVQKTVLTNSQLTDAYRDYHELKKKAGLLLLAEMEANGKGELAKRIRKFIIPAERF